jgi:hypothetical protein
MLIFGIIGLLGFTVGFFAGAGYATRGAHIHRDEAERYAAECNELHEEAEHLRQLLGEPTSGIVPKQQIEALRKLVS